MKGLYVLYAYRNEKEKRAILQLIIYEKDIAFFAENQIEGVCPGEALLQWVMKEIRRKCLGLVFPSCIYFLETYPIASMKEDEGLALLPLVDLTD
jgi:hypothetical protein